MTSIEMENYMDDNLAVWNAVTGYRQQVELREELRRKREARQRAKAIRRERRRQVVTVLIVAVLLGAILAACVSLVNAYTDKSAGITPVGNEPISTLAGAELLNNDAPTVKMLDVTAMTFAEVFPAEAETEPAFVYRMDVPLTAELQEVVWDACQEHDVEYALVLGLIEVESTFRTDAVSCVGCYGLMQLNPQYFPADLAPAENIQYGVAFLAEKLDQYAGDTGAALTAYNAGHDTGSREYAEKVMAAAEGWR